MDIWRYQRAGTCERTVSMDIPHSFRAGWSVRGNGIHGLYGCCLNMPTVGTVTIHLVNWLEQTLLVASIPTVST
jgi:hypothetical protein